MKDVIEHNFRQDWDEYFMRIAYAVAMKSKDQSTHMGCVIVGIDNEIRSVGYNSFPRYIDDNNQLRQKRPIKYFYFEHAERNAIYNAARIGVPLKGCRLYVLAYPCADCARAIIQSGIIEVIIHSKWVSKEDNEFNKQWKDSWDAAEAMFRESGTIVRTWEGEIPKISSQCGGKEKI